MWIIDADALIEQWQKAAEWAIQNGKKQDAKFFAGCIHQVRNFAKTIDPESLRPKGHWNIRCEFHHDNWTGETDEEFYLECSECRRKVWDVNQMAAMNGEYRKLIADFPYCHCGAKMEE